MKNFNPNQLLVSEIEEQTSKIMELRDLVELWLNENKFNEFEVSDRSLKFAVGGIETNPPSTTITPPISPSQIQTIDEDPKFPLLAPDGAAGIPLYSFKSDPDTGFFWSNQMAIRCKCHGTSIANVYDKFIIFNDVNESQLDAINPEFFKVLQKHLVEHRNNCKIHFRETF